MGMELDSPRTLEEVFREFEALGEVTVKTVFGAWGLFQDGVMFALLSDGQLYLRGSARLRRAFAGLNMQKLYCARRGKALELHYYRVGPALWEDRALLVKYAKQAVQCAVQDRQHEVQEQAERYSALVRKHFLVPAPRSYACASPKYSLS